MGFAIQAWLRVAKSGDLEAAASASPEIREEFAAIEKENATKPLLERFPPTETKWWKIMKGADKPPPPSDEDVAGFADAFDLYRIADDDDEDDLVCRPKRRGGEPLRREPAAPSNRLPREFPNLSGRGGDTVARRVCMLWEAGGYEGWVQFPALRQWSSEHINARGYEYGERGALAAVYLGARVGSAATSSPADDTRIVKELQAAGRALERRDGETLWAAATRVADGFVDGGLALQLEPLEPSAPSNRLPRAFPSVTGRGGDTAARTVCMLWEAGGYEGWVQFPALRQWSSEHINARGYEPSRLSALAAAYLGARGGSAKTSSPADDTRVFCKLREAGSTFEKRKGETFWCAATRVADGFVADPGGFDPDAPEKKRLKLQDASPGEASVDSDEEFMADVDEYLLQEALAASRD